MCDTLSDPHTKMAPRWQKQENEGRLKKMYQSKKTGWVTGKERPDNRLPICILGLPRRLPHLCWTERGIVWIKNPLKDKRLMSQSWMMTMKNDSLLPSMHSQDFPSTPAALNPPSSPVHDHQTIVTVSWDWLQWKTAAIYQQKHLTSVNLVKC